MRGKGISAADLYGVCGFCALIGGVWRMNPDFAMITGGVLCLIYGLVRASRDPE